MPVYIGKSGDLVGCYRCLTDTQTTEDRATQLLYSIQFKLSHAIDMGKNFKLFDQVGEMMTLMIDISSKTYDFYL